MVLVITGATSTGKTTLANFLISNVDDIKEVVQTTTRPRMSYENGDYPYSFVDDSEYDSLLESNKLITVESRGGYRYGVLNKHIKEVKSDSLTIIRCGVDAALLFGNYFAKNRIRAACIYMHCKYPILLQRLAEKDACHEGNCTNLTYTRINDIYENHNLNFSKLYNHGLKYHSYGKVISIDSGTISVVQYPKVLTPALKYLDPSSYASRINYLYLPREGEHNAA